MADLQRQKMEEERKKQIEFMKASKESMSMTELSNFTNVFVYSCMWLFVCMCESLIGLCFYCFYVFFQLLCACVCTCVAFVFVFFVLQQIWFCWAMYISTCRLWKTALLMKHWYIQIVCFLCVFFFFFFFFALLYSDVETFSLSLLNCVHIMQQLEASVQLMRFAKITADSFWFHKS